MRLLNGDKRDIRRVENLRDARTIIDVYQLTKSQLVFSLSELVRENQLPVIYEATTKYSNIMTAFLPTSLSNLDDARVRYAPRRGLWDGGEEVLMFIPRLDRRKGKYCEEFLFISITCFSLIFASLSIGSRA